LLPYILHHDSLPCHGRRQTAYRSPTTVRFKNILSAIAKRHRWCDHCHPRYLHWRRGQDYSDGAKEGVELWKLTTRSLSRTTTLPLLAGGGRRCRARPCIYPWCRPRGRGVGGQRADRN
jgi:hypothetical protein